jgi:hypothetical protein
VPVGAGVLVRVEYEGVAEPVSQINDIVIIAGGAEAAAITFLSGHLTEKYASGAKSARELSLVGDGRRFGGDKVSGTHVYGCCLNGGPVPEDWGDLLDSAPWHARRSVTVVMDFELFGTHVWSGRTGWLERGCDGYTGSRGG